MSGEAFCAGAEVEGYYAEIRPPLLLAVRGEFLGRDFDIDNGSSTLPHCAQLASVSDAHPHVVVARTE
jgi:hypothetical protein